MSFDCNGKNVMSIGVVKSAKDGTETVMIEDEANCTMTNQNKTDDSEILLNNKVPILYINCAVLHWDKASINQKPIVIISEQTSTQGTINFSQLIDYSDNTTMYTDSTPANKTINWLMDDKSENSDCENPSFV